MRSAPSSDTGLALAALAALAAGACRTAPDAPAVADPWLASCPLALEPAAPLSWQPCGDDPGCRRLRRDRPLAETPIAGRTDGGDLVLAVALGRAGDGHPRQFRAAALDGPGLIAASQPPASQRRCGYYLEDIAAGELRLGSRAGASSALVSLARGARPILRFLATDGQRSTWDGRLRRTAPGRDLELYDAGARRWLAPRHVWRGAERGLVGATPAVDLGDRVAVEVSRGPARRLFVWEPGAAAVPLGSGEPHDAAGNLGSDGSALVWSEGRHRVGVHQYRDTWIAAAPAAAPGEARRIGRSHSTAVGGAPFAVGCGRALHRTGATFELVELDTGRVSSVAPPAAMSWGEPVALTCDELVATARLDGALELVRLGLEGSRRQRRSSSAATWKGRATMPKRSPSPALTRSATSATRATSSTFSK